jgi:poly(3-hydroxybutyrate) depolymerase
VRLPDGRIYLLHAAPATQARALVVVLAAAYHDAWQMESISGFSDLADRDGFAVAYGQGVDDFWNAGGCCGGDRADDLGYLRQLVHSAESRLAIDTRRVYVVGMSNGGMMAFRAVCEAPGVFAAAGVVAGALMGGVQCSHTVVHVFEIHGTDDTTVPLDGGRDRSGILAGVLVPAQSQEIHRVGRGSVIELRTWDGGHAYPRWASAVLWDWLAGRRTAGETHSAA